MKPENFLYIDKTGAWAVVAFTIVAGAMMYDTLHCVAQRSAHGHAPANPISQPAEPSVTNRVSRSGTNVIDVYEKAPAAAPAPAPSPAQPGKLIKPVPIPNPREIGGDASGADEAFRGETGGGFTPVTVVFSEPHRISPGKRMYSPCQFFSAF